MGRELFEAYPSLVAEANEILGYDVRELCLEDPKRVLNDTQFTQPAVFVVTALAWLRWRERNASDPIAVAGHSLGEYAALMAAGVFDFRTALTLVRTRGRLMAEAGGGAMAAVLGMSAEAIEARLRDAKRDDLHVANLNTSEQTVVAGPTQAIEDAAVLFEGDPGVRYIRLKVSAAFHTPAMEPARQAFARTLREVSPRPPRFPVIANLTASPYPEDPEDIREVLAAQISWPVRWYESASKLLGYPGAEIEEIGPGNALTRMMAQIRERPMDVDISIWTAQSESEPNRETEPVSEPALQSPPSLRNFQPKRARELPAGGRVFAYTGHGSQYYRMGEALYREHPGYRAAVDACFEVADAKLPRPLGRVMFEDYRPFDPFERLRFSTPALVSLGVGLSAVMRERGVAPDATLGYGLGEWLAAVAAGALSWRDALELSLELATLIEERVAPGAMLAVFDEPAVFAREPECFEGCTLAGIDFSRHFIVSGPPAAIEAAAAAARERERITQPLPMLHALHGPALDAVEAPFLARARAVSLRPLALPMYSPSRRAWLERVDAALLWEAVRAPVHFLDAIEAVRRRGGLLVDLGPSGTLAGFVRHHLDDRGCSLAALNRFARGPASLEQLLRQLEGDAQHSQQRVSA
ncbi:acyltransferase domain-containing protein [Pseudenhygromyxa sp. WMMC2535]|nr:acyltransferase domain-containing protein [Pseudenhygromyxa sp. WMMC2535]